MTALKSKRSEGNPRAKDNGRRNLGVAVGSGISLTSLRGFVTCNDLAHLTPIAPERLLEPRFQSRRDAPLACEEDLTFFVPCSTFKLVGAPRQLGGHGSQA